MKERKECKIIQDLLPNYIEKLTSGETNQYIEEHLNECKECKNVLKNMQKELKFNNLKRDGREVKYIKKFNKKFKLLRNILLIIVTLFIIVVGRKTIILNNLNKKAETQKNSNNYHLKTESYSNGYMTIIDEYYKDEKRIINSTRYTKPNQHEEDKIELIFFEEGNEKIMLVNSGENKSMIEVEEVTPIEQISFTSDNFFTNLYTAITTNIDKIKLNGQECYIIREGNMEKFIDVNSGLAIKMIDNENNITVDYHYEYGVVKDTDIVKPDTTGYTINE